VTIRFITSALLWMVHCDHASIWHHYGDMKPQMLDARTLRWFYTLSNACIGQIIMQLWSGWNAWRVQ